jgi:prevent-host-death family protein
METVDVVTLRTKLGQILDRVLYQHARLTVTKNGTAVAALVPLADLHAVAAVSAVSTARLPVKKGPPVEHVCDESDDICAACGRLTSPR